MRQKSGFSIPGPCLLFLSAAVLLLTACGQQSYLQRGAETGDAVSFPAAASETKGGEEDEITADKLEFYSDLETGNNSEAEHSSKDTHTEAEDGKESGPEPDTVRICVQITGAVEHPGVYFLPEDARLYLLVEAAGGLRADADAELLNQARRLMDGELVQVLTTEQTAAGERYGESAGGSPDAVASSTAGADARVNLNTADAQTLMTLPGIGEAKAEAILAYRTEHGSFSSPEEIMQVPGIKTGAYEKIKDRITIR